jgi:hypothetical protein
MGGFLGIPLAGAVDFVANADLHGKELLMLWTLFAHSDI